MTQALFFLLGAGRVLKVDEDALVKMLAHRQLAGDAPEAGGVLLGRRTDDDHLLIDEVSEPLHEDGRRVQDLQTNAAAHGSWYDGGYAHGVRCVLNVCELDGVPARVSEILRDPLRAKLLSDEGSLAAVRYPMRGIDVSEHNKRQGWEHHFWQGIRFAAIRVSYGGQPDSLATEHLDGAYGAGLRELLGYHYANMTAAEQQAARWLLETDRHEQRLGQELALAIDLEDLLKPAAPWPRREYRETARRIVGTMAETKGRPVAIYSSRAYLLELQLEPWWAQWPLWLADWTPPYPVPAPWTSYTLLQDAVLDDLDRDVFDGSAAAWRAALGLGGTWAAPPAILGQIASTSDAAAGRCSSSPEDFCERPEGPPR